jgi:hypothetical protein
MIQRHRASELQYRSLRSAINGCASTGDDGEVRGDIDDITLPRTDHVPQGSARAPHQRGHIRVHHSHPRRIVGVQKGASMGDAGIVHQDIEAAEGRERVRDQPIGKTGIGDITG